MSIDKSAEENVRNDTDDTDVYYEQRASLEEVYIEETEEEVHSVLESYEPAPLQKEVGRSVCGVNDGPHQIESPDEQLDHAAEELITGDSDDPPLSGEAVLEMIQMAHPPKTSSTVRQ
jgi:hypothetical protein